MIYIVKGLWKKTQREEMGAVAIPCSTHTIATGRMLEYYTKFRESLPRADERQLFKMDPGCTSNNHLFAQGSGAYESTYLDLEIVTEHICGAMTNSNDAESDEHQIFDSAYGEVMVMLNGDVFIGDNFDQYVGNVGRECPDIDEALDKLFNNN